MNISSVSRPLRVEMLQLRLPLQPLSIPYQNFRPYAFRLSSYAHRRCFHLSHPRHAWVKNQHLKVKDEAEEARRKAQEKKRKEIGLRDDAIPYKMVQVASRDGLGPIRRLQDILHETDHANDAAGKVRYHVQLTANDPSPIVKIIDAKEDYEKQKAARIKAKLSAPQNVQKEIQLTWKSSDADVDTKLEKAREDLEKGYKVVIVLTPKKRVAPPNNDEMRQRVDDLVQRCQDVGKEWRVREFTRTTAVIYLQGTAASATDVSLLDKAAQKQLEKEKRRQREEKKLQKKREREVELYKEHEYYIHDHST